jgi:hypothetical protein
VVFPVRRVQPLDSLEQAVDLAVRRSKRTHTEQDSALLKFRLDHLVKPAVVEFLGQSKRLVIDGMPL